MPSCCSPCATWICSRARRRRHVSSRRRRRSPACLRRRCGAWPRSMMIMSSSTPCAPIEDVRRQGSRRGRRRRTAGRGSPARWLPRQDSTGSAGAASPGGGRRTTQRRHARSPRPAAGAAPAPAPSSSSRARPPPAAAAANRGRAPAGPRALGTGCASRTIPRTPYQAKAAPGNVGVRPHLTGFQTPFFGAPRGVPAGGAPPV